MLTRKNVIKDILVLLACILIGAVLITVANYIPINEGNKTLSMQELESEGNFPEVPSMQGGFGSFHSMNPTALELATDKLMLKMAFFQGEGQGIEQAFRCYSTHYGEEYSRYWHGYVVVLRVLFLFFDYYEIRIINTMCQALIIAMLAYLIWKEKGRKYMLAFLSSYFLLMPMAVSQCLQYTWVFYVTFGGLLIYVKNRSFWEKENRYIYFFTLMGAVTIYLDLLTYPLLSWGLPLVWWILLQDKEETPVDYVKKVVISGFAWIAGYGGMWVGKWVMGSLVLRENLFRKAISEALLWTVNEGEDAISLADRFEALYINWSTYEYKFYALLLVTWLAYWVINTVCHRWVSDKRSAALLLIFSSSFVWYMLLAGHSVMHHIFTHRTFGVSIAAVFGVILLSTDSAVGLGKKAIYRAFALTVVSVVAIFCMFQIRDEYYILNGGYSFYDMVAEQPVTMKFKPSYSEIRRINVGFRAEDNMEGFFQLTLLDGEEVVDQVQLPMSDFVDANYHEIEVNWNLQPGKDYIIALESVDFGGVMRIWLTNDNQMPLAEFGSPAVGAEMCSGQLLSGITYWCVLTDFSKQLVFVGAFLSMFLLIAHAIMCMCGGRFFVKRKNEIKV